MATWGAGKAAAKLAALRESGERDSALVCELAHAILPNGAESLGQDGLLFAACVMNSSSAQSTQSTSRCMSLPWTSTTRIFSMSVASFVVSGCVELTFQICLKALTIAFGTASVRVERLRGMRLEAAKAYGYYSYERITC